MAKFCLFESGDVVGPFSAEELMARAGFGAHSLVCPDEYADNGEYWKEAASYPDFPFGQTDAKTPSADAAVLSISQPNIVPTVRLDPVQPVTGRGVDSPFLSDQPVAQPVVQNIGSFSAENPIEEYFNTMKEGDLGNILGIPDKTNSDLELARVLEKQLAKTDSQAPVGSGEQKPLSPEEDPFNEFTKPPATPEEMDQQTKEQLNQDLLDLQEAKCLPLGEVADTETAPVTSPQPPIPAAEQASNAALETAATAPASNDKGLPTAAQEFPLSTHGATEEIQPKQEIAPVQKSDNEPAPVVGVSASAARKNHFIKYIGILGVLMVLIVGIGVIARAKFHAKPAQAPVAKTTPQPIAPVKVPVPDKESTVIQPVPLPVEVSVTPEEQAQEIVKKYVLDANRGTIEQFLAKRYATELASGYVEQWSAEPLHRKAYVVKYRLAKARQEPIIYIFQVDTSKKKLTGALNNITLDLVGKINS